MLRGLQRWNTCRTWPEHSVFGTPCVFQKPGSLWAPPRCSRAAATRPFQPSRFLGRGCPLVAGGPLGQGCMMEHENDWLVIAGLYIEPLLSDPEMKELATRMKELDPDASVFASFSDALDLMDDGATFWLDENGSYRPEAVETCSAVWKAFGAILQEQEFRNLHDLASTVRWGCHASDAVPASALAASWSMALAAEALTGLYEAQAELQRERNQPAPVGGSARTPDRIAAARLRLANAQISHAEYLGMAHMALLLAGLYRQFEEMPGEPNQDRLSDLLRAAVKAPSVARARAAGHGNKAPDSRRQIQAAALKDQIDQEAQRIQSNRPGVSFGEIVSILTARGIASPPTIRKYLRECGYPEN